MAKAADVQVGYNGQTYLIPAEISEANARQPGIAAAWIEDQLQGERDRKAAQKAASDLNVEREFRSVKQKLAKVDAHEEQLQQQADAIKAYRSANAALTSQVQALEATGTGLGTASGDARNAAQELALQTTNSAVLLETMRQREEQLKGTIDDLEGQVTGLEGQLAEKTAEAAKLGKARITLEQERSNRCLDKAYQAEEVARGAESTAAQALQTAKGSRQLTKDQFTEADLLALVQSEIRLSAEQIVEMVIDSLKPQFPHGFAGPRMDADYVDQTNRDRVNSNEMRVGMDEAVKAVLKRAGSV